MARPIALFVLSFVALMVFMGMLFAQAVLSVQATYPILIP